MSGSSTASPSPVESTDLDPRRWRALAVCLVAGFMTLLDVSIVNVALPAIRDGLDARSSDLAWVLSGYTLAFGLALVPAGRLGDARGRRRMFVAGLAVFTAASAVCGLAGTPTMLIAARLVQGVGGAVILPQVAGLIQQLFHGAERGRAFGTLAAVIGVSTAVGPALGGTILVLGSSADSWRWVFFVNLPVGLVAIGLALRLLPTDPGTGRDESLDPVGVLLLALGLFGLLLPLLESRAAAANPAWWLLAGAGAAILAAFTAWERHHRRLGRAPVIDLALFRQRSYGLGAALACCYFAGFTSVFFVLTLFFQNGLGYSPLAAGLAQTPFAVGGAVASAWGGKAVASYGRRLVAVGLALTVAGLFAVDVVAARVDSSVGLATAVPLLVAGVGSGLVIAPNLTVTLALVPVAGGGSAGGVVQTAQRVGSAAGIALVNAVFFTALRDSGSWQTALSYGMRTSATCCLLALAIALVDVRRGRRVATG